MRLNLINGLLNDSKCPKCSNSFIPTLNIDINTNPLNRTWICKNCGYHESIQDCIKSEEY